MISIYTYATLLTSYLTFILITAQPSRQQQRRQQQRCQVHRPDQYEYRHSSIAEEEQTTILVSYYSKYRRTTLTFVKLAVAFPLATGEPETELNAALEVTVAGAGAGVAAADVADAAPADELLPARTAGPTSSCLPANGSVLNPQLAPAVLNVLPYMRQML